MNAPISLLSVLLGSILVLGSCDDGVTPRLMPLRDQEVRVSETLQLEMRLEVPVEGVGWSYSCPTIPDLNRFATLYESGSAATFRWAPLINHVGRHEITFYVSAQHRSDAETIAIDVVDSGGAPRFMQPPPGGVFHLDSGDPCVDVDIEVIDEDSFNVEIREVAPFIDGGALTMSGSHSAFWRWCPTPSQIDSSLDWLLRIEADDGDNTPVGRDFEIVLVTGESPDPVCPETSSCELCLETASCGFCDSSLECQAGDPLGPLQGSCDLWIWLPRDCDGRGV